MQCNQKCEDALNERYKMYEITAPARFWNQVKVSEIRDCWTWAGTTNTKGYGQFRIAGQPHATHRLAYEFIFGKIPDGMQICHKCDNPPCCNPLHLFCGTGNDNAQDMIAKGRKADTAGERNGMFGRVGEKHHNSILTDLQAQEIIDLYKTGRYVQKKLAQMFNTTQINISCITRGHTWKHLKR